jgi:hypothetical protein
LAGPLTGFQKVLRFPIMCRGLIDDQNIVRRGFLAEHLPKGGNENLFTAVSGDATLSVGRVMLFLQRVPN